MLYIVLLNLSVVTADSIMFWRNPFDVNIFFRLSFSFVIGLGIPFIYFMDAFIGYKFALPDLTGLEYQFAAGYCLIIAGSVLARLTFRAVILGRKQSTARGQKPQKLSSILNSTLKLRSQLWVLALVSIISITLYAAVAGISFGKESYETRYESALGMGILLIFFPGFLPYAAFRLLTCKNRRQFFLNAAITLAVGVLIYVVLSGYRQILIAVSLLTIVIAVQRRYIPAWAAALVGLVAFPIVLLSLSFLRYAGEHASPFTSGLQASLYYIQGDLFPVDAPIRIRWYCEYHLCPGPQIVLNHLARFVPRFIWPDKPEILLDAAGYYTQIVVNYGRNVTLSATILGEAWLIGGPVPFVVVMFLSGFMTRVCTIMMGSRDQLLRVILISNVYIGFFWVREGLSNGVYRIIVLGIFYVVAWAGAPLANGALRSRSARRRIQSGTALHQLLAKDVVSGPGHASVRTRNMGGKHDGW